MSSSEVIQLSTYAAKPIIPCAAAVLIATVLAVVFVLIKGRGLWFGSKNFVLSLFYELRSTLAIKLACAWIKLVVVCFFLVSFTQLQAEHYIFLLVPCVGILLINGTMIEFITHLVSVLIQLVGLVVANILCSYILQFQFKLTYIFMYILVAMILILYSVYIFISEIDFISIRRSVKIDYKGETRSGSENA